jgi:(1->4)-alpha-D-glucan 1-alpha-D-glucosylmutase
MRREDKYRYFHFFDIDWDHPWEGLQCKLLAPFLGDLYGKTLEQGRLKLIYDEAGFAVDCSGIRLPLRLSSYAKILSRGLERLQRLLRDSNSDLAELKKIILDFNANPDREPKIRLWSI